MQYAIALATVVAWEVMGEFKIQYSWIINWYFVDVHFILMLCHEVSWLILFMNNWQNWVAWHDEVVWHDGIPDQGQTQDIMGHLGSLGYGMLHHLIFDIPSHISQVIVLC